jgi:hypothetical protein
VTRERLDDPGLQLQVYAGRDTLAGWKRRVIRPVLVKSWAVSRRTKQVQLDWLTEGAGRRGSRSKTEAELAEQGIDLGQSVCPVACSQPTRKSNPRRSSLAI